MIELDLISLGLKETERRRRESEGVQRITGVPFGRRASDKVQGKECFEPDHGEPQLGGREL